jgi:CheY-like chemotaxis protein
MEILDKFTRPGAHIAASETSNAQDLPDSSMPQPHVLVIDDDPLFRSLMASMLRKDFQVTVSSEGAEGYYKAVEHPPQIAILDIQMPGWDGMQTLKAFRGHQSLAHIPIMMLTSDASRLTVSAAIEAGANEYVIKTTLSRDDFLQKVHRLLAAPSSQMRAASPNESPATGDAAEPSLDHAGTSNRTLGRNHAAAPSEDAVLQAMLDNWE